MALGRHGIYRLYNMSGVAAPAPSLKPFSPPKRLTKRMLNTQQSLAHAHATPETPLHWSSLVQQGLAWFSRVQQVTASFPTSPLSWTRMISPPASRFPLFTLECLCTWHCLLSTSVAISQSKACLPSAPTADFFGEPYSATPRTCQASHTPSQAQQPSSTAMPATFANAPQLRKNLCVAPLLHRASTRPPLPLPPAAPVPRVSTHMPKSDLERRMYLRGHQVGI